MVTLIAMVAASALTGGSVGAIYLTMLACLSLALWRDKRKEPRG
jgi:hypothetical protein